MIQTLMREHPNLDFLMAETLVKLHEQGKLAKYEFLEACPELPTGGGITIENLPSDVKACEAPKAD
jgi:hypothetical protein